LQHPRERKTPPSCRSNRRRSKKRSRFTVPADPLFGGRGMGLIQSWMAAKRPVEFHLYEQGGHGFGMYQKTTTSTGWFEAFVSWLGMHGYVNRGR
jgi:hypothetical protein